jgi:hypothetical protein
MARRLGDIDADGMLQRPASRTPVRRGLTALHRHE